jgi:CRP-like cAMP-binding protein
MIFGEVALLYDTRRTASVRSKDNCMVRAINEESFKELLKNYPQIKHSFIMHSRKYKDYWKMFQISRLT